MALGKFLDPKNDFAFKQVFGTERNKDILLHFLNDIFINVLPPIEEVTLLPPNYYKERVTKRTSIVDILCEDRKGHKFIVEMQLVHAKGFLERIQYYAAQAYTSQRTADHQEGEERIDKVDYDGLCPVTVLAITDFTLFPEDEAFLSHHRTLNTKTHKHELKALTYSFLELPKFTNTIDKLGSLLDKWTYFLKHAQATREEDLPAIIGKDTILKKAYAQLDRFKWTDEQLTVYDSVDMKIAHDKGALALAEERGEKKGLVKGRKEGVAQGHKKAMLDVAKKLFANGTPYKQVLAITNLPKQLLDQIRTTS